MARGVVQNSTMHQNGSGPERLVRSRGFSLIDLLVAVAVMAALIAMLLPALSKAQESARRVKCSSNIRQIGLAIQMYAYDNKDQLPPSVFDSQGIRQPGSASEMIFLRASDAQDDLSVPQWDGLGILHELEYLNHPGVFYCPSHGGSHPYSAYSDGWTGNDQFQQIAGNFHYRIPDRSRFLAELDSTVTLVADGMRRRSDYNHEIGNNFMKADLSVGWYADHNGRLLSYLADDGLAAPPPDQNLSEAWAILDRTSPAGGTTDNGSSSNDGPDEVPLDGPHQAPGVGSSGPRGR